jgi:hypothetical protein
MKKTLLVLVLTVGTLVSKAQSLGTMGGITITKESKYYNTALWGAWVDFGKWGIQYSVSGSLNGSQIDVDNFINGKSKEFNAGILSQNYGIFINTKSKIYYGGGIQSSRYYNAETSIKSILVQVPTYTTVVTPGVLKIVGGGVVTTPPTTTTTLTGFRNENQNQEVAEVVLRNTILPYGVVGIKHDLGTSFIGRVEVMISKVSSINVGVGIKL